MALWSGRFTQQTDSLVQKFSESISYDRRLYPFDIQGSQAHAKMLAKQGIISQDDADKIVAGLNDIKKDIDDGNFDFSIALEDIHMNIESRLTERIGQPGARLHTGRSRNDQIATDERLYMRHEADDISLHVKEMQRSLVQLAADWPNLIMPGFTHLQHAQPILFAHHLLAYVEMFGRDRERLADARKRLNRCPLGAGAIAGCTLPLDRHFTAEQLGFDDILHNSMDAVGDRDYIIEFLSALSIIAMHLSRLSEDIILWFSQAAVGGHHPVVQPGVRVHRTRRRLHDRLQPHAAKEESGRRGTDARQDRPCLWPSHGDAYDDERPSFDL